MQVLLSDDLAQKHPIPSKKGKNLDTKSHIKRCQSQVHKRQNMPKR